MKKRRVQVIKKGGYEIQKRRVRATKTGWFGQRLLLRPDIILEKENNNNGSSQKRSHTQLLYSESIQFENGEL